MPKILRDIPSFGIGLRHLDDSIGLTDVQCAGTSISNPANLSLDLIGFLKTIVLAHWVDASNFCLALPTGVDLGASIEIYTDASTGHSITVFLSGAEQFLDGSTSFTMDHSKGRLLRPVKPGVWGIIGT